jgi:Amt family ammonium transporter
VAITPACASVNPLFAIILGALVGGICAVAVGLKYKLGFDDSLDVVGVHLVGGASGAILIGFFATATVTGGANGLFFGGGLTQLGKQTLAVVVVGLYSFILSWIIGKVIDKTMGFRISAEDEVTGIDTTAHAESGYDFTSAGGSSGLIAAATAKPLASASAEKE